MAHAAVPFSLPLPKGFCVPAPVVATINGLEGLATYDHTNTGTLIGLLTTAVTLWWFAWYVRFSQRAQGIRGSSLMRNLAFYYCVSVGAFGAIRGIWDTGRLLLVGAAFHNLMEWGFLGHVWLDQNTAPRWFTGAVFYVWTIITMSAVLIPSLLGALAFEQTLGIQCDYFLLISYAIAWATRKGQGKEVDALWRSAFFAGLLHFGQIWPLVAGTVLGPCHPAARVIDFILTTVSIPCFFFYTDFALRWDELRFGTTFTYQGPPFAAEPLPPNAPVPVSKTRNPFLAKNEWGTLFKCIGGGLFLGLLTIGGVGILPRCPNPTVYPCRGSTKPAISTGIFSGTTPAFTAGTQQAVASVTPESGDLCFDPTRLVGTTTVVAKPGTKQELLDAFKTMPIPIRKEEGCVFYDVLNNTNALASDEIFFVESWSSSRTLMKHMLTSPTVKAVFGNPQARDKFAKESFGGLYSPLVPCAEANAKATPKTFTLTATVDAGLECIWKILDDWNNTSWVQGSKQVEIIPNDLHIPLRRVTFDKCSLIEMRQLSPPVPQPPNGHALTYQVLDGCLVGAGTAGETYSGTLSVTPAPDNAKGTLLTYTSVNTAQNPAMSTKFSEGIYSSFVNVKIPYVKNTLEAACGGGSKA